MRLVVITPLLDADGPARGKATFGNELKRNHKIQTQKKKKGFSYREREPRQRASSDETCVSNLRKAQRRSERPNLSAKPDSALTIRLLLTDERV